MRNLKAIQTITAILCMLLSMLHPTSAKAQTKVADKEIIGVWVMTSMKYDGENKEYINGSYSQVKVYRANGEYACAEICRDRGKCYVLPHEWGTYSLVGGKYTEMGRDAGTIGWKSKTRFEGRWKNRNDKWKKVIDFPESLTQHIVDKCKAYQSSPESMQKLMNKYIFNDK